MEGNVGVGESLHAPRMNRDNGFAMARGQPAEQAFPKEMPSLLLGLSGRINLDYHRFENLLLSRESIFLPDSSNSAPLPGRCRDIRKRPGCPGLAACSADLRGADQLPFNSGLIFFSNSAIEVSPLIFSPLTKKVGVESTLSTSLAYFWTAAILSSSA